MKQLLYLFCMVAFSLSVSYSSAQISGSNHNNYSTGITYQTFYNELQPYGNWISSPDYGYVWQPGISNGFRPYETNGQWVSTVDGWAWASDYSWGWAPFHYGRWLLDPAMGWVWIPGYEWAPAWVQWGRYNNNYAWAPLSPGINISVGSNWRAPAGYWSFIPYNCIYRPHVSRYIVRNNVRANNIIVINNYNHYSNNVYYHRGPEYKEVEQYTHTIIKPLPITASATPGKSKLGNRLEIYRPSVAQNENDPAIVPQKVKSPQEVKTVPQSPTSLHRNRLTNDRQTVGDQMASSEEVKTQGNVKLPAVTQPPLQNGTAIKIKENTGGIRNEKSESLPVKEDIQTNPVKGNTGGIKAPPVKQSESIETPLPQPQNFDRFQHRNQPDERSQQRNTQLIDRPVQKIQQPVQKIQQPVERIQPPVQKIQPPVQKVQPPVQQIRPLPAQKSAPQMNTPQKTKPIGSTGKN